MRDSPLPKNRRSPCPVACALDILGDRWTLLVVRDLLRGADRFKEFSRSPERIPTNVLSDRLNRLVRHRIVERVPAADGTKHSAYCLTPKGQGLAPLLQHLRAWGLAWEKGTRLVTPDLDPIRSPRRRPAAIFVSRSARTDANRPGLARKKIPR